MVDATEHGWLLRERHRAQHDERDDEQSLLHRRRPNDGSAGRISPSLGRASGGGGSPFFTYSSITFSSARAALSILRSALFPSWHSYGYTSYPACVVKGTDTFHGAVHVSGSVTVASYVIVSSAVRVSRSTTRSFSVWRVPASAVLLVKPLLSITSVSPSHLPVE